LERRLAAILAADVGGYSRLMGADEAGTLLRMARLLEAILMALAASWMACAGIAGAQTPDPRATTHIIDFPHCCPRPGWWDEVKIETRIDSMETFLAVWQDQALTDEQKAKALFQAIEDFVRRDDDITAAAVNYYYWVDRDYDHIRRLYEFGVGYYLDYDRPLENYGGKAGDMSAGMVNNLAKLYLREGKPERAVPWLRYILDVREAEVNDHLLETAAAHLGDALNRLGRGPEAIEVLLAARRDYDGDWEKRLDDELATVRGEMGLPYYLHDTRLGVRALGLAMIVALGGMMLWRRRRGRG
jgi:tetratricopeptide (TPR) repeat protein